MAFSEDEFEAIYDAWAPALFNFTARLVGCQEARDLVQEVFLRLFRARIASDKLKPWLYRVAYNLCIDHYRKNKAARTELVPEIQDPGSPDTNPETVYLARESMARFFAAFWNLPPEQRALLLLRGTTPRTRKSPPSPVAPWRRSGPGFTEPGPLCTGLSRKGRRYRVG